MQKRRLTRGARTRSAKCEASVRGLERTNQEVGTICVCLAHVFQKKTASCDFDKELSSFWVWFTAFFGLINLKGTYQFPCLAFFFSSQHYFVRSTSQRPCVDRLTCSFSSSRSLLQLWLDTWSKRICHLSAGLLWFSSNSTIESFERHVYSLLLVFVDVISTIINCGRLLKRSVQWLSSMTVYTVCISGWLFISNYRFDLYMIYDVSI